MLIKENLSHIVPFETKIIEDEKEEKNKELIFGGTQDMLV